MYVFPMCARDPVCWHRPEPVGVVGHRSHSLSQLEPVICTPPREDPQKQECSLTCSLCPQ